MKMATRSFVSGELDPGLHKRADLQRHTTGLKLCRNFVIRAQGGAFNRPGMQFVGEVVNSTRKTRLIPFEFNTEQTYVLEFGHLTMRVIKDGGYVLVGAGPAIYEIATPYTEDDLFMIKFTQSADVMTLCHRNYAARDLSRLDHDDWTLSVINFSSTVPVPSFTMSSTATIQSFVKTITNITSANPAVVTSAAHGLTTGDVVNILEASIADGEPVVVSPHPINGGPYTVTVIDPDTFSVPFNSSGAAYNDGGVATFPGISSGNPAVITTAAAHGFTTGQQLSFSGATVSDSAVHPLNGQTLVVSYINATSFSVPYDATGVYYRSGGTAGNISGITIVGSGASDYNKTYRYVVTATVDGIESFPSAEAMIDTPALSVTAGVRLVWGAVAGAEYYTIYKDASNGSGLYGFIGESKEPLFEDYNIGPDTTFTPPEESNPISTAGNYPGTVAFYQQRKLFANTDNQPQTMFATQIGVFNSLRFSRPARDDDAITFTVAARQVNEIRHIIAVEDLMLLTSGAIHKVTEGRDFVLTPSTIGAKPQSYIGASDVRPAVVSDSILFVQDKGSRIRDLNYGIDEAKYTGNDLSIMAEHLFTNRTVVDMAYAVEPCGILWCVMSDGKLIALTYQKEHKVWAWHRHETDGFFESVCVISEDERDDTYFVVRRLIDGVWKRYVEKLADRVVTDAKQSIFLDSCVTYNGAATTTIPGLNHLEGREVTVLSDGNVVRGLTVTSGTITLPRAASIVHIGIPYTCEIETLGIDSNDQPTLGRKKNVAEVAIQVLQSRGGWVGPNLDNMIEIKPRFDSDGYNTIALKTFEQRVNITPDWNDDGSVIVQQRDPLPMTILAVTPEFDIGG